MNMKRYLLAALAAFILPCTMAVAKEEHAPKYGDIKAADFNIHTPLDSDAAAVVIADVGDSYFEGDGRQGLLVVFKHTCRIKILRKNGFDAADISIVLYHGAEEDEQISDIKGATYNLENGEIVTTKLDKASIFRDKINEHYFVRKFTMPAVKVGSVIEYTYEVHSPFIFHLQPWDFQGQYPRLWSEYNVSMPDFLEYVHLTHGLQKFDINTTKYDVTSFTIGTNSSFASGSSSVTTTVTNSRWVMKNVLPMKEEHFTSCIDNYTSGMSFQFSGWHYRDEPFKPYMKDWKGASEKLLEEETFGAELGRENAWLDPMLDAACGGTFPPQEQAQKIYSYVRDNFTCTSHSALYLSATLRETVRKKSGNVADINMLLAAMLRRRNIRADPVILSTRKNGFVVDQYPMLDRYNYVICRAVINGRIHYLDAAHPYLGFGKLSPACYNGAARVIDKSLPVTVVFDADSLQERKVTMINISRDPKDSTKMQGFFSTKAGYVESQALREKIKELGEDAYFKKIPATYNFDVSLSNTEVQDAKNVEEPVKIKYAFSYARPTDQILYINPMLMEATAENDFKPAERLYPVEMPYAMNETYVFDLEIPAGYKVDELPKSQRVKLNENEGTFEYLIENADGHIRLQSTIRLRKATFPPEDYDNLRRFFSAVISKQAEQVVLKKI